MSIASSFSGLLLFKEGLILCLSFSSELFAMIRCRVLWQYSSRSVQDTIMHENRATVCNADMRTSVGQWPFLGSLSPVPA